jgi:hypothetical protein
MLEIAPSSKNSWKNTSPLFIGCYNSFSSIGLDARIACGCSSTTNCYKSSFSISVDVETNCNCSSTIG